jgi:hypothetical protein
VDYPFPRRRHPDPHVRLSIYPAVQNMLLAARALGLGATLTTLYLQFEKGHRQLGSCRLTESAIG